MIVTREQDKMVGHAFLLESGCQLWRRVSMELDVAYFILTYEIEDRSQWVRQTELYWQVDQLLACCAEMSMDERYRFVQVALISPSWMNRQAGWQMDTIAEIWRTPEGTGGHPETRYVTCDGKLFSDYPHGASSRPMVKILSVDLHEVHIVETPA